jgi:hypothetical protein
VVEIDEKLRDVRLTLELAPRPPERLFPVLARRAFARLSVVYRVRPFPPGGVRQAGSLLFADGLVSLRLREAVELPEVWGQLGVPVEVEEGVEGTVRMDVARRPLAWVMDRIAAQVGATWVAVVRLEARRFVDPEAETYTRMRSHFSDLARLSSMERREELAAEMETLAELPTDRRAEGLRRMADDVLSLATLLHEVPGEHRAATAPYVLGIAADYRAVLLDLSEERRGRLAFLFHVLDDLRLRLQAIH